MDNLQQYVGKIVYATYDVGFSKNGAVFLIKSLNDLYDDGDSLGLANDFLLWDDGEIDAADGHLGFDDKTDTIRLATPEEIERLNKAIAEYNG